MPKTLEELSVAKMQLEFEMTEKLQKFQEEFNVGISIDISSITTLGSKYGFIRCKIMCHL